MVGLWFVICGLDGWVFVKCFYLTRKTSYVVVDVSFSLLFPFLLFFLDDDDDDDDDGADGDHWRREMRARGSERGASQRTPDAFGSGMALVGECDPATRDSRGFGASAASSASAWSRRGSSAAAESGSLAATLRATGVVRAWGSFAQ